MAGSPLHRLEHGLHKWVAFLIVPLFGLANGRETVSFRLSHASSSISAFKVERSAL